MLKLNYLDYQLEEKLVHVNRISKTTKGGRVISFSALSIVGNRDGIVGIGYGKSKDVQNAINKSYYKAKINLVKINLNNNTIRYPIKFKKKGISVLIKPTKNNGLIVGGVLRYLFKLIGVKDIIVKIHGSTCKHVLLKIVIDELCKMNMIFVNKKIAYDK